jgi:hypothetical protein
MPEVDGWSITTDFHHFITHARVPKPKSSRRTVVNRDTSGCESRRNRHGSTRVIFTSGTRKIANPRRLGRRDTRSVTGVPDHFPFL